MEQPFRCPTCRAEFSTREQLEQHMRQHGSQTTGGGGATGAPRGGGEPTRTGGRPGEVGGAGKQGGGTGSTERAASPADLRCPRCGVEFSTREELDRHVRAQHRSE